MLAIVTSFAISVGAGSPAPAAAAYCPIGVRVDALPDHADELAFSLWADDAPARATGTFVIYSGARRYEIPFANAIAAENHNPQVLPTPIVVRFDGAAAIDSGYVARLDAPCIVHNPFVKTDTQTYDQVYGPLDAKIYPDWSKAWTTFLAQAATTPPIALPAPTTADVPACPKPYVAAHAITSSPALYPDTPIYPPFNGTIGVKVALNPDGKPLGMRIENSNHQKNFDDAAAAAALRSRFAAQIYRCQPVSSDVLYLTQFTYNQQDRPM